MDTNFLNLYNEFVELTQKGDMEAAKDFLNLHYKDFPQELQDKITFAFFEESLVNESNKVMAVNEVQKQGLEAMDAIEKAKKAMEEQAKILDLQDDLTK